MNNLNLPLVNVIKDILNKLFVLFKLWIIHQNNLIYIYIYCNDSIFFWNHYLYNVYKNIAWDS